jgi:hypothetical protein
LESPSCVPAEARRGGPFGGLTASEAASRRHKLERARQAEGAERDGEVRVVRVPAHVGRIITELEGKAVTGDVQAARELRSWLDKYPPVDESLDLAVLNRRTRDRLLQRLLAELAEEDEDTPPKST